MKGPLTNPPSLTRQRLVLLSIQSTAVLPKALSRALQGLKALYGPLLASVRKPTYLVTSETEDGREMSGQARLYADVPGEAPEDERKEEDC